MIKNRKTLRELRLLLESYYQNEGQLRTLAFDLGMNWYDLAGETRQAKILSLITEANQHGELPLLVEIGREDRPDLAWPDLSVLVKSEPEPVEATSTRKPASQMVVPEPTRPKEEAGNWGGLEWAEIPAGNFVMGSDGGDNDEQPAHLLWLDTYWISKFLVTNADYMRFVQSSDDPEKYRPGHWNNWRIPQGKGNHPVVGVSWYDAIAYCNWLTLETREVIGLPSEAEWEKGARGMNGSVYPWGDTFDKSRCNTKEGGIRDTTPVDQYRTGMSQLGVWDMTGNVREWTRTIFDQKKFPYPYAVDDGREALEMTNVLRVLRSGSWYNIRANARAAFRYHDVPNCRSLVIGFRLVRRRLPISS